MSLSADPQFTADPNGKGGLYGGTTGTTLGNNASVTVALAIGVGGGTTTPGGGTQYPTSCLMARVQALLFGGGTVAAVNGLQWQVLSSSDGGTTYDTLAYASGPTIAATVSTTTAASMDLAPGHYNLKLTNLDLTNAIKVALTVGTLG